MRTVIKGGRILDPASGHDAVGDLWMEKGKITALTKLNAIKTGKQDQTIEATGKVVAPGLVDMHVHLREPGAEYKET
ncbi:dihydroorotase, partial [bacterium]|nr:dihydroorotase [bacterium]